MKKYFLPAISGVVLSLSVLLAVFWLCAFDWQWYEKAFSQLGVYQNFSPERVAGQTENLFAYLNNAAEIDQSFYTVRELVHLQDIKKILLALKIISAIIAAIFLAGSYLSWHGLGKEQTVRNIFWAGSFSLIFYLAAAVLLAKFFEPAFLWLHRLLFQNDFWQLDPAVESLIVIFPPALFAALGLKIITSAVVVGLLIMAVSGVFFSFLRKRN